MLISLLLVVLLLGCVYNLLFNEIINKNEVVKNIISLYKLNTIQGRIDKNILAYSLFLRNPILRIGTDYSVHFDISSPHNSLLQIMCENGIVGIVLMFLSGAFVIFK